MSTPFFPIIDPVRDTQFNFDRLAALLLETGGQSAGLRFGTGTFAFVANNDTTTTVTHGLGKTPIAALVTVSANGSASQFVGSGNLTSTTFDAYSRFAAGSTTANYTFFWLVIG